MISTLADLITWSPSAVAVTCEPHDPACTPTSRHVFMYGYTSLLDPNSPSRNFETVGKTADLYRMHVRRCGGMHRDLVRLPVPIEG